MKLFQNFLGKSFVKRLGLMTAVVATTSVVAQNNSLDFNGNGYVEISNTSSLLAGTNFTIEAMINVTTFPNNGWGGFLGRQEASGVASRSPSLWVVNRGSTLKGLHYDSNPAGADATRYTGSIGNLFPNTDTWYHLAWVKEGTEFRFYVDGQLVHTRTGVPLNLQTNSAYNIGRNDNNMEGFIDEVRIWSVARTQAEIQANMNLELTGSESGLDAYYNFNEGNGTALTDLTGNYSGTFQGGLDATDWNTSGAFTTWDTNGSADWANSGNWSNGVPGTTSPNVGIPAGGTQPEISSSITVNNLNMAEGASLTVQDGGTVTANGNAEIGNNATITIEPNGQMVVEGNMNVNGAEALVIKSNASGTGNLVHTGDDINYLNSGSVKVERYLSGHATEYQQGYHYMSSPVSGHAKFGDMANLYAYRESDMSWLNHTDLTDGFSSFTAGHGYAIRYTANVTKEFTGTLNDGDISVAITHTANGGSEFEYFNLVGNPYPSSISASDFYTANSSLINPTVSLWNGQDYATYNTSLGAGTAGAASIVPDGNISVGQAFFVESTASGNLSFTNAMRNSDSDQFFRQSASDMIRLNLTSADQFNQLIVASHEEANEAVDAFDSKKLKGNAALSFYSMFEGNKLAIQTLPSIASDRVIRLGVTSGMNEVFEFTLDDKSTYKGAVYLWDGLAEKQIDLTTENYSVLLTEGEHNNRFKLIFDTHSTGVATGSPELNVYISNNQLQFDSSEALELESVSIYNVNGQLIRNWNGQADYDVSEIRNGAYLVHLQTVEGARISTPLVLVK